MTLFDRIERLIGTLCTALALLGACGLLVATVLTCVSILLKLARRGMDALWGASNIPAALEWVRPILGEEELVKFAVGFTLFAVLPLVMFKRGHVTVDLFQGSLSARANRLLDLAGDLALALIAYLLMTRQWFLIFKKARRDDPLWVEAFFTGQWGEIADRLRDNAESQILGIKLWPTYVVAEACTVVFFVVALFCVIRSARALWRGQGGTHA